MATYKAEFMSHYYEGRLRPMAAYTMGLIDLWAGMGGRVPGLANALARLPFAGALAGIASRRKLPRFAAKPFSRSFRPSRPAGGRRVLLWPDTFNEYFLPDTARAAALVLERAGYEVILPRRRVCCGRPLYDWGFLGRAQRRLTEAMETLAEPVAEGIPVIGLEPGCVSVFRDELLGLFPDHPGARALASSTWTLSEFIAAEGARFVLPRLERKAIVQAHCHHKSVMRFDAEEKVLRDIGLDLTHPDSGCCGMAGAFGFEARHYELSRNIGERVILPMVRDAGPDTLIVANGFSCREQIEQETGRRTLHLAEVLKMGYGIGDR
jgi:Fe-S oxidoreductase